MKNGVLGELTPFIATKVATEVDAPVGIAINRRGHIVVGQMGEINKPRDSLLTFYSPNDGKMLMNLETNLFDIAGLAYTPASAGQANPTDRLYAVDFAWMDEKEGGLYRLDQTLGEDGTQSVHAVRITSLDKPTALAFAPNGTLYVTVYGTREEGSTEKPGKLLKIMGDL